MIGNRFGDDLAAAGLAGLPISWGPDGVFGLDRLPPDRRVAVEAAIAAHDPAAPSNAEIDRERNRRLLAFVHNGRRFDLKGSARTDILSMQAVAQSKLIMGTEPGDLRWADPDQDFAWIASDNTLVAMDAIQFVEFARAAAAWHSEHMRRARQLKDMRPPPADYRDDKHWPA